MHFELYKDSTGDYGWRLRAGNGKIVADSGEGYRSKTDCQHGIDLVRSGAASAPVQDKT